MIKMGCYARGCRNQGVAADRECKSNQRGDQVERQPMGRLESSARVRTEVATSRQPVVRWHLTLKGLSRKSSVGEPFGTYHLKNTPIAVSYTHLDVYKRQMQ